MLAAKFWVYCRLVEVFFLLTIHKQFFRKVIRIVVKSILYPNKVLISHAFLSDFTFLIFTIDVRQLSNGKALYTLHLKYTFRLKYNSHLKYTLHLNTLHLKYTLHLK